MDISSVETGLAARQSLQWPTRLWHAVLATVVVFALTVQLWLLLTGGVDANSGRTDSYADLTTRIVRFFSYFTVQSNILVLAVSLTLIVHPARDGRLWRVVHLDALMGIVITGVVFGTVLVHLVHLTGLTFWTNVGFHYVSPCMTFLGWLLFGPRPRISWSTVRLSFVWPMLWIVYTFAHGAATGWYPYPFLNADKIGYSAALGNTGFVLIGAGVLAAALQALDSLLPATRSSSLHEKASQTGDDQNRSRWFGNWLR